MRADWIPTDTRMAAWGGMMGMGQAVSYAKGAPC